MKKKKRFTLIKLLAVIIILTIYIDKVETSINGINAKLFRRKVNYTCR